MIPKPYKRHDKQYDHCSRTVQFAVTKYPGSGITQQNTNKCSNDGNTYGVDEGIDCFGMFEKLLKIGKRQMPVIISKSIHNN